MIQGSGRTPWWCAGGANLLPVLVVAGLLAACSPAAIHTSSTPAEPSIVFPDAASAAVPGGVFVDTSRLAQVQPGLARSQVYALLGMPHFREGMDAPQWNYVFNYRDGANQVQQCQFLVMFDADDRVMGMHWQPDGCQDQLLARVTPTPPMATWRAMEPPAATPAPTVAPPPVVAPPAPPAVAAPASPAVAMPAPPAVAPTPAVAQTSTAPTATPALHAPPAPSPPATPPVAALPPVPEAAPAPPAPDTSAAAANAALVPIPTVTLANDEAFAPGSAKLTHAGREHLDMMLLSVQVPTQYHELHVVGFSDRIGTAKNNRRLSQIRAEAVRKYLVEGGVPADVVTATGKGEQDPVAECGKKKGSALTQCLAPDRRIEINGTAPADAIAR